MLHFLKLCQAKFRKRLSHHINYDQIVGLLSVRLDTASHDLRRSQQGTGTVVPSHEIQKYEHRSPKWRKAACEIWPDIDSDNGAGFFRKKLTTGTGTAAIAQRLRRTAQAQQILVSLGIDRTAAGGYFAESRLVKTPLVREN
jgi:hypothetical protein